MLLSPHFSYAEFTRTSSRLPNDPSDAVFDRLRETAWAMEGVRAMLGGHPLKITSGFRTVEVNLKVGGSPSSDHVHGYAVDFQAPKSGNAHEVFSWLARSLTASRFPFDQLILYPSWVHISFAPRMRRQIIGELLDTKVLPSGEEAGGAGQG